VVGGIVIEPVVKKKIMQLLGMVESKEEVQVLFAVESGSRAWGFPSLDSDYDVRFVYIHKNDWYLSIDTDLRRDVIERPLTELIDLSGWDIRKTLRLFAKANPPLIEWLSSPIIYKNEYDFQQRLKRLLPTYYEPRTCIYHYHHMANRNYRDYLKGTNVWTKKYLYVLRPLLATRWIEQNRGPVPMSFHDLLVTIHDHKELITALTNLVERKMNGDELDRGPAIPILDSFVIEEMERQSELIMDKKTEKPNLQQLQAVFSDLLREAWKITT
jgi:uncharacterized protein